MKIRLFILLFVLLQLPDHAQNSSVDSLLTIISKGKPDTATTENYFKIGHMYYDQSSYDTATLYYNKALALAQKLNYKSGISKIFLELGYINEDVGNYSKALEYYGNSLQLSVATGDQAGTSNCYLNLGNVYRDQANYPKALEYYLKSLKICNDLADKKGIGKCYVSLGNIYLAELNYTQALDYYLRSIKIFEELNGKSYLRLIYGNLGVVYQKQLNYPKAFEFQNKALKMDEELGDKIATTRCYVNIGTLYFEQSNYSKALDHYLKALKLCEETQDKNNMSICNLNIGTLYNRQANYTKAILYLNKVKQLSTEIDDIDNLRSAYEELAKSQKGLGNYKDAYESQVEFQNLTSQIFNIENSKQLSELKTNFEVEKKESELKAEQEKKEIRYKTEQVKTELEIKDQKLIRNIFIAGLLLLLFLIFYVYQNLKKSKKSNEIIEQQKYLVEQKQKEIIDSINYAKHLQEAILPSQDFINKYLQNNFILYKPKDIVAGDFYWAEKVKDIFFIAAADSTGHGVPGAMVSVVCSNALNRAVKEFNITDTGRILDKTRDLVLETFEKSSSGAMDGMDISLLCIDAKNKKISWSGANNRLWYIHNNELNEIKADKQSIGKTEFSKPFTTHQIKYVENTFFYLFTDGFADQFGGPESKKFKYKQFSEVLKNNNHLPLSQQLSLINNTFENWKGNLEQVDDVCVIGIKI